MMKQIVELIKIAKTTVKTQEVSHKRSHYRIHRFQNLNGDHLKIWSPSKEKSITQRQESSTYK